MIKEVTTQKTAAISGKDSSFMRLSQCVGVIAKKHGRESESVLGLAHIHPDGRHESILEELFQKIGNDYKQYSYIIQGGQNWFNSGYSLLGRNKALEINDFLRKNNLEVSGHLRKKYDEMEIVAHADSNLVQITSFCNGKAEYHTTY